MHRFSLKNYWQYRNSGHRNVIFIGTALSVGILLLNCSVTFADKYQPRKAPGPLHGLDPHGDDPHGDDPHKKPDYDPGLPANAHDRDPYAGSEGNDKRHPNRPLPLPKLPGQ